MEGAGLTVWTDACGNVHGTWSCGVPEAKTVYMGSHLDTVKEGGLYDGMLGVVGAVEAFRAFLADPAETSIFWRPMEKKEMTWAAPLEAGPWPGWWIRMCRDIWKRRRLMG